jgi:hypothetical protein
VSDFDEDHLVKKNTDTTLVVIATVMVVLLGFPIFGCGRI